MGRKSVAPLSFEDKRLIVQCKAERNRINDRLRSIRGRTGRYIAYERAKLKREASELTDAKLAEKFETTKYAIWYIPCE